MDHLHTLFNSRKLLENSDFGNIFNYMYYYDEREGW